MESHLLQNFISHYGYIIVFFASLIEGESIILTASILASQGKLDIQKVVALTFIGTLFADQGLYFVGRAFGHKIFNRFPTLKAKSHKIMKFFHKHQIPFILSFRFIYGIRILSPIVIGMSEVNPRTYMILNFIAALIWTGLSCAAGYYLGEIIFSYLHKMNGFLKYGFILLLSMVIIHIIHRLSKKLSPIPDAENT